MEPERPDQRKELRYPLEAQAILERNTGEQLNAATVNVSGSGMLVLLERDQELRLGEEVWCSLLLYQGKPAQSWGLGTVMRVEGTLVAIEFKKVHVQHAEFE